jgi:hypothetical protein
VAVTAATAVVPETDALLAWHASAQAIGLDAELFHWNADNNRVRLVTWTWWNLNFTWQWNREAYHRMKVARVGAAYGRPSSDLSQHEAHFLAGQRAHAWAATAFIMTARPRKLLRHEKPGAAGTLS